jgi:hypothetical protein
MIKNKILKNGNSLSVYTGILTELLQPEGNYQASFFQTALSSILLLSELNISGNVYSKSPFIAHFIFHVRSYIQGRPTACFLEKVTKFLKLYIS